MPSQYSVEEWCAEFDRSTRVLRSMPEHVRFVFMSDLSAVSKSDPRNRARSAEFMQDCKPMLLSHVVAMGIIVSNGILRGAITAVTWVANFPIPTKVFTDRRECEDWLAQQLAIDQLAREPKLRVR